MNPFRKGAPRFSDFDEADQRGVGYDAWSVWLNTAALVGRPAKDFGATAKAYMRKTADMLTAKLERLK